MVPNNWLIVKAMPLNRSTKEDRKLVQNELEAMESILVEEPIVSMHPAGSDSSALNILTQSIEEVLGRNVMLHHSFISQGGDSISAMQLVGVCRQHSLQISTSNILTAETILNLANKATWKCESSPVLKFDQVLSLARAAVPDLFREIGSNLEAVFPCSPSQEGILISQSKDSSLYKTEHTFRISLGSSREPLELSKLGAAWASVVARHQSLRSVFVEVTCSFGSFIQVVQKKVHASILVHKTIEELELDLKKPTVLTEPPHRFRVASYPDGSVMCKLEMSHVITDAASVQVILEELALGYEEKLSSSSGPLYSDYISYLALSKQEDALIYWVAYLENVQPCRLQLPSEDALAATTSQLASMQFEINLRGGGGDCLQVMQQRNLSIACLIQAAWGLLLSKYTSQDEVCFAYISASRHLPVDAINATVGPIVATLPCRLTIDQNKPAAELLKQAKEDMLNGLGYSHASLDKVMHKLNFSLMSMMNSIVSIAHDWELEKPRATNLLFDDFAVHDPTDFEIALSVDVRKDGKLKCQIDYWTNIFSATVVQRLKSAFETTVVALVRSLNTPLQELDTLSPLDRSLIYTWNQQAPATSDSCIHDVISRQAILKGGSDAIISTDSTITYNELEQASDKMAGLIQQSQGAVVDSFVPICFEKSPWAIIALLAVLKSGSAFVLVDPCHPIKRIQYMCKQMQASTIIVSPATSSLCEQLEGLMMLECSQDAVRQLSLSELDPIARPSSAAYAVFTSGTTGEPKAIVTEHAAYCSAVMSRSKSIMRHDGSRHLQYASYSFDVCLEDILTTLMVGGTVCVPSEDERMNSLAATMVKMRVNSAEFTPTVANTIMPTDVPSLEVLVLGGESMTAANVQRWASHVHLMNGYVSFEQRLIPLYSTGSLLLCPCFVS